MDNISNNLNYDLDNDTKLQNILIQSLAGHSYDIAKIV